MLSHFCRRCSKLSFISGWKTQKKKYHIVQYIVTLIQMFIHVLRTWLFMQTFSISVGYVLFFFNYEEILIWWLFFFFNGGIKRVAFFNRSVGSLNGEQPHAGSRKATGGRLYSEILQHFLSHCQHAEPCCESSTEFVTVICGLMRIQLFNTVTLRKICLLLHLPC